MKNIGAISIAKTESVPFVLFVFTFVTGLVDAVSFLGLGHVFTANMTGNVIFLGFSIAGAPRLSISRSLISIIAFLIGATLGGRLAVRIGEKNSQRWLFSAGISEAILLFTAAIVAIGSNSNSLSPSRVYAMIVLTAIAMGLRNATVRRLGVADMTTTVLTLTLTALAADSSFAGGNAPRAGRRITSVLLMFAGALIGALLLTHGLAVPLFVCAMSVLVACGYELIKEKR